jgi:hypothetical protein
LENEVSRSAYTPYIIILCGLVLFAIGMVVDLVQHGVDFLLAEFQGAPLAHALPAAGILVIIVGTLVGWRQAGKD